MSRTVCITQSNYIPWRGYFDLIRKSDEFIISDNFQYTRWDWRNRNVIKTRAGLQWLTVPVQSSGRLATRQRIDETRVVDGRWVGKHLKSFHHAYRKAPHFEAVMAWLEPLYEEIGKERLLSVINERLLRAVSAALTIQTPFRRTTDYIDSAAMDKMDRTTRIIELCRAARATRFLVGPAAKIYLDEQAVTAAGIEVEWMDYANYATYPQLWGDFQPRTSIVDLLFCVGDKAGEYIGSRHRDREARLDVERAGITMEWMQYGSSRR
jgi:WbqC-like protein family